MEDCMIEVKKQQKLRENWSYIRDTDVFRKSE